jgi:hypothetical protein
MGVPSLSGLTSGAALFYRYQKDIVTKKRRVRSVGRQATPDDAHLLDTALPRWSGGESAGIAGRRILRWPRLRERLGGHQAGTILLKAPLSGGRQIADPSTDPTFLKHNRPSPVQITTTRDDQSTNMRPSTRRDYCILCLALAFWMVMRCLLTSAIRVSPI